MNDLSNVTKVIINNTEYRIDGTATTLEEIKDVAVNVDAGLANADAVIEGDTIYFKYRAGTKGADISKVIVDGREYAITPGTYNDPKDIQNALVESGFTNLANAEYVINGDTMTFRYKAGTKGA